MKRLIISIIMLFTSTAQVQAEAFKHITIESKISSKPLTVKFVLPKNYDTSDKAYPLFITTAGGSRQDVVRAQFDWLSHVDFAPIPESILLVMPELELKVDSNKFDSAAGGMNQAYAQVLLNEVLPVIDKQYRTTGYRVIEGFSSFANFPLYLLRHHSDAINGFFIFSPGLELDKSGLVGSLQENWTAQQGKNNYVYLNLGTFKRNRPLYEKVKQALLAQQNKSGLIAEFADFSEENYLSAPNLGLIAATESLFADLQPNYKRFHQGGSQALEQYFTDLSKKYKQAIAIDSKLVDLSFSYVYADKFDQAIAVMQQVVEQHQEHLLWRIRLGQILIQADRKAMAKKTLITARAMAIEQEDQEAISFIGHLEAQASL